MKHCWWLRYWDRWNDTRMKPVRHRSTLNCVLPIVRQRVYKISLIATSHLDNNTGLQQYYIIKYEQGYEKRSKTSILLVNRQWTCIMLMVGWLISIYINQWWIMDQQLSRRHSSCHISLRHLLKDEKLNVEPFTFSSNVSFEGDKKNCLTFLAWSCKWPCAIFKMSFSLGGVGNKILNPITVGNSDSEWKPCRK